MLGIMRLAAVLLISLATVAVSAQSAQTPDALARALQDRYQKIVDFSAEFSQSYRSGALKTQSVEQGTVQVKKPGKMRWIYTRPERKEFVSDGKNIHFYQPAEKQVMVSQVPPEGQRTTPELFLAGQGNFARDFTASTIPPPLQGTVALKLVPRQKDPDYEYFVVMVDPATLQIRALRTLDRQGGESTLTFTKLKENQRISDKTFEFRIPRGVEVVTTDD